MKETSSYVGMTSPVEEYLLQGYSSSQHTMEANYEILQVVAHLVSYHQWTIMMASCC